MTGPIYSFELLAALALLGVASAQSIELNVDGGSVPGSIRWKNAAARICNVFSTAA